MAAVQTCRECGAAVVRQVIQTRKGMPNEHTYHCKECGYSWDSAPLGRRAARPRGRTGEGAA